MHDPLAPSLVYTPIIALLLASKKEGIVFLILTIILTFILFIFETYQIPRPNWGVEIVKMEAQLAALLIMIIALFFAVNIFDNEKNNALNELYLSNEALVKEKNKSDGLLFNILPIEVANELKANGFYKARRFENVSVLFTDFVNFTGKSQLMEPEELVGEIDLYFKEFDSICKKYGVEKIKTIGDAYLAVCGLPIPKPDYAKKIILAALEMTMLVEEHNKQRKLLGKHFFDIRLGIHAGPVVAGIVGVQKFAYDIWGDTVNMAARMEQNSEPGKINISREVHNLVKTENYLRFETRGKILVKGKGDVDMYYVMKKEI